jgi:hypothetical protein
MPKLGAGGLYVDEPRGKIFEAAWQDLERRHCRCEEVGGLHRPALEGDAMSTEQQLSVGELAGIRWSRWLGTHPTRRGYGELDFNA